MPRPPLRCDGPASSAGAAKRTIDGYEAVQMMRKGQVPWLPGQMAESADRWFGRSI